MKYPLRFSKAGVWFLTLTILVLSTTANAQLSGAYTIDASKAASKTNYLTFTSVVADLDSGKRHDGGTANGKGVSGSVVFNVADGTYKEQVTIAAINGSSAANSVTFISGNGDSSKVILIDTSISGTNNNYTLRLRGTNYFTFKQLTFIRTDANNNGYASIVEIDSPSSHNNFFNCQFLGSFDTRYSKPAIALIYSPDSNIISYNTFKNNLLRNGIYGFYMNNFGLSGSLGYYNNIVGNIFDSTFYCGLAVANQFGLLLSGNVMSNYRAYNDCIFLKNCSGPMQITKNKIINPIGTNSCLTLFECNGTAATKILVANNVFSNGPITSGFCSNVNIVYNNVSVNNGFDALNSYTIGTRGTNIENNIFANFGGGSAYEIDSSVSVSNFNDFFSIDTPLIIWNNYTFLNLSSFQKASGLDANSISTNPYFKANSNLFPTSPKIYQAGTPLAIVTDDINGNPRNATAPCIGAYEGTTVFKNDAGVSSINYPYQNYCPGTLSVYVTVTNFGSSTLTSSVVNWSVNGVKQTLYNWTGSIKTTDSTKFNVGSYTFNSNKIYTVKAWTSSPNGATDSNQTNDTSTTIIVQSGLSGTYTIGLSGADYFSFGDAIYDLKTYGLCGPVVFNVADGTYYEEVSIDAIPGSSNINTVTFQSQRGDSSKVILYDTLYNSGYFSPPSSTLTLAGGNFVTFQKMTIEHINVPGYPDMSAITITAPGNFIFQNDVIMFNSFNNMGNGITIYYDNALINNNLIRNTEFGLNILSYSISSKSNNIIENNTIDSFWVGIWLNGAKNGVIIKHNLIHHPNSYSLNTAVGIDGVNSNGNIVIEDNIVNEVSEGIILDGGVDTITNNMIYAIYGIDLYDGDQFGYFNIFDNTIKASINIQGTKWKNHAKFFNNNVVNIYGLEIYNFDTLNSGTEIDYNNYYFVGTPKFLKQWQSYTGQDKHSISVNPDFVSSTNLYATNTSLARKGITISGITDDIDSQIRPKPPTIGANEIAPSKSVTALFYSADTVCSNTPISFADSSVAYICGALNHWRWIFGDGATDTSQNPTHSYTSAGSFKVTLKVTSAGSCTDSVFKTIQVYALPKAKFVSDSVACTGIAIAFTNSSTRSLNYTWEFGDGKTDTIYNPSHNYNSAGTYTVRLKVSSPSGCIDSSAKTIKVYALPHAKFTSASAVCENSIDEFIDSSSNESYRLWKFGDGKTDTTQNPSHIYTLTGKFKVILEVYSLGGCNDTISKIIQVFAPPTAKFIADSVACSNSKVAFTNSSSNALYQLWNFGDGSIDSTINTSHLYTSSGKFKVTLSIYSSGGCTDSISKTITVYALPKAKFVSDSVVCLDSTTAFIDSSLNAPNYLWEFGDGKTSTSQNVSHIYTATGFYDLKLIVNSSHGCTDSFSKIIHVDSCKLTDIQPAMSEVTPIRLYPNPANNTLTLDAGNNKAHSIAIYDVIGKEVYRQDGLKAQKQTIDLSNFPAGIYLMRVGTDNGYFIERFVRE